MIVQGGNAFLAQQGNKGKALKSEAESNDFQDLLVGANKKKATFEKPDSKKTYGSKRKEDLNAYDENSSMTRRQEQPAKKEAAEKSSRVETSQVRQQEEPQQKAPVQDENMSDKKFAEVKEEGSQMADSINLSELSKNTLEKNQKLVEANENSFENMMAQMKMEAAQKNEMSGIGQAIQNKIGGMNANSGKIKLGAEFDLTNKGETLSLASIEGTDGLKALAQEGGETASDSSLDDLESLFNQYLEQDYQIGNEEGVNFADSLNQAEGGKSDHIENMNSIVKQARAFVDEGGGSMEIHLQPEGLGKVHLKVAVQDGQVAVEMMADNLAAKKALEEGLFDIKSALEGQKLMVETLKVEMSPDYQKDFSDLANHMQEQANRDFAQDFLGQFQQERESRVGGMFDSLRSFQQGPKEPELTLNRNPYHEAGKGRSVNLVA